MALCIAEKSSNNNQSIELLIYSYIIYIHTCGQFVHHDLRRPSDIAGERFDNILLTPAGLRLIDVGISALQTNVGDNLFKKYVAVELQELIIFKEFFLSR